MDVSMKQKSDTKKQPEPTLNPVLARRRLQKFNGQLQARPEMLAPFESILALAAQSEPGTPFRTADEVEALVVEAVRKLGHQTLTPWAHEAQGRAVEDGQAEHPAARLKKKRAELVVRGRRDPPRGNHAAHRGAPRAAALRPARAGELPWKIRAAAKGEGGLWP